ncbi:hypothetical protein NHX12_021612 [Muraenolepis orangiensis]|uniref:Uncharacterized protein n=1 Tax=Muraenolepis orangiensis TaxID=630683 RepID=A0A9Q0EW22_9TELE|nr:hypothetical protein NHX12_021612 [Muraenolepis orangiensis]
MGMRVVDKGGGVVEKGDWSAVKGGGACGYCVSPPQGAGVGSPAGVMWWYAACWNLRTSLPQLVQPGWRLLANSSRHGAPGAR